ncbi:MULTISPECIES: nucleotidyltransferase domain-containing protein [unclassified Paenibacillus]|uniref:nucleotidyltransferase domain-containing protein n=1 Tax=unclassified Paenibacillus TaxID=185978 RepID=UPI0030F8A8A0
MKAAFDVLSKERQLVILCSRGVWNGEHEAKARELLSHHLDWKDILYQGLTHRVLNLMFYHLKRLELVHVVEEEVVKVMKSQSKVYALRNQFYFEELGSIYRKINEKGLRAVILKGNYLAAHVYPSIETRTFNDLDLLISLSDGEQFVQILESLGYIQGEYNRSTDEIIPGTRKQKIMHQMATHELQECLKKTEHPFVSLLQVDLNHDVLWKGNCPYKISTEELLSRARETEVLGHKCHVLDYEDFLIQLACHLYKEAVMLNWIADLRDLKLYKYADMLMYIEHYQDKLDWDKLISFCQEHSCEKVVYYAFFYVNYIYGNVIPEHVMKALEPEDKAYLDEYGIENTVTAKWEVDFFTRIFDTSRILQVSEEMLTAKNRFWSTRNEHAGARGEK